MIKEIKAYQFSIWLLACLGQLWQRTSHSKFNVHES